MLQEYEGSVAALREIERQYSTLQVLLLTSWNASFDCTIGITCVLPPATGLVLHEV